MNLGVCAQPEAAEVLAAAGFDYIEVNVVRDLQPEVPVDALPAQPAALRDLPLPAPVANVFLPGALKLTGDAVDLAAAERYVRTAFAPPRPASRSSSSAPARPGVSPTTLTESVPGRNWSTSAASSVPWRSTTA
ncbi:MAG: hypothetical protein R2854_27825 [Caldilineaceae bacterium]